MLFIIKNVIIERKSYIENFFKIERHPNSKKIITSSKSNKVSILEKLEEIKRKLDLLQDINQDISLNNENTNIHNNSERFALPKYISIKTHEQDNNK